MRILFWCISKSNLFLWCKAEFSASLLQYSVSHDPSQIILICWFAAQDKFILLAMLKTAFIWNRNLLWYYNLMHSCRIQAWISFQKTKRIYPKLFNGSVFLQVFLYKTLKLSTQVSQKPNKSVNLHCGSYNTIHQSVKSAVWQNLSICVDPDSPHFSETESGSLDDLDFRHHNYNEMRKVGVILDLYIHPVYQCKWTDTRHSPSS